MTETHPATRQTVRLVREAVVIYARAFGMTEERLDDVRLAVSEAVTNVVLHAYRNQPGLVHVTARVVDDDLWVLVSDDGRGAHTPPQTPGLGYGLAVITDTSDEFALLDRAEGGTEARMRFALRQPSKLRLVGPSPPRADRRRPFSR
ncbi:MAG: ATP-binding protein [Trebonia sp.]